MAIRREKDISLVSLSTFRIGGTVREVVTVETEAELVEALEGLAPDERWMVIGGGSNVVFPDGDADMTLIRLSMSEIRIQNDAGDTAELVVGAGAVWDDAVRFAVENKLSGIEALSAIPGSAGATPVQNVGAYGTEIKDVLVSLRAYDRKTKTFVTLANTECAFAYRDSIFKHERDVSGMPRYIITEITLKLSHDAPHIPNYPGVAEYFAMRGVETPTLTQIREAITVIRWKKLPDPSAVASVGSFFKNPFVTAEKAEQLRADFPDIKLFPGENSTVKVPAGWLIEHAGLKGKSFGPIATYEHNALVLVNVGNASRGDLAAALENIVSTVNEQFGIRLQPEPELL